MTSSGSHKALYGVLLFFGLCSVVAGALVIGYTRYDHTYNIDNCDTGFKSICLKFRDNDSATWTNFVEVGADGCLTHPEDVINVHVNQGILAYNTAPGRALLAAGIIAMAVGGLAFILCCVGLYYAESCRD